MPDDERTFACSEAANGSAPPRTVHLRARRRGRRRPFPAARARARAPPSRPGGWTNGRPTRTEQGGLLLRRNTLLGELSAEFLGTFTLIIFGVGVVAQTVLTTFTAGAQSIHWAWGIGVVMGVYVAGGISGAHINPAVTLALAVRRGFAWGKVLPYWGAQTLGAFVAALLIRWNYWESFDKFDPAKGVKSQLVFSTLPGNNVLPVSQLGALRDQIIGTGILVMVILAIIDSRNMAPGANMAPFIIGLLVVGIGMTLGADAGYAINPARDF